MDIQRDIFFYFYPVSWIGIFQDSRKIKLTPTTKNQILTLVHEMAKSMKENNAYDFKTSSGNRN